MASASVATPRTTSILHDFPVELMESLLLSVPASQLQQTTNSVMQVFPDIPISKSHLVRHLKVSRGDQLKPMWMRLREDKLEDKGKLVKAVKSFNMESWRGDADLMNNILRLLPAIEVLRVNMGTNFAPEHLQEVFEVHRPTLQRAEIRFRPYVDKASYYQFLKGSYFDSAIDSLIKHWPETPSFTHLSLVQDIPPRFSVPHIAKMLERKRQKKLGLLTSNPSSTAASSIVNSEDEDEEELPEDVLEDTTPVEPRGYTGHGPFPYLSEKLDYARPKTFAQPIVFFDIRCLARLALSPATKHITHLRLRVPTRDIARVLSEVPDGNGVTYRSAFPRLVYLDLSTTNVRIDGWLPPLVRRFAGLRHLVLDRTNVFGFQGREKGAELCAELGRVCVMMGLARGKEREREIAAWDLGERKKAAIRDLELRRRTPVGPEREAGSDEELATDEEGGGPAQEPEQVQVQAPVPARRVLGQGRRGHRSVAMSSFSIRERPNRNRTSATTDDPELVIPPASTLYLVLPPLPSLRSIGLGGEAVKVTPEQVRGWNVKFHEGWLDGLSKVAEWAARVGERCERAKRAAETWVAAEEAESIKSSRRGGKSAGGGAGGKKKAVSGAADAKKTKPPLDVQMYRYPYADEPAGSQDLDETDPRFGLIKVEEEEDYKAPYAAFLAAAKAYLASQAPDTAPSSSWVAMEPAPVVLCLSADCEGPMRKGEQGERVDGRAAMGGSHVAGCGHLIGREVWGWQEV